MFKRLRNRLLLLNMSIISIVMIVSFAFIYYITYTNVQKENQDKMDSIIRLINVSPGNFELRNPQSNRPNARVIIPKGPFDFSPSFAVWVTNEGKVMNALTFIDMPGEIYEQIVEETWRKAKTEGTISLENRKWQYVVSPFQNRKLISNNGEQMPIFGNVLYQITYLDITDSSKTLTQLLLTFVIVGVATLFMLFGVSVHFANRSIRPIEENWEKQKQFVADASHELKTPLAIINANADALLANGEDIINEQKKWIHYIQTQAGRMGKLVNDMLYLAKVEDTREIYLPFNISNTVLDVVASMEVIIFERGIILTQAIEADVIAKGDCEKIKQAILILLDNAAKYTNDQGTVEISLKRLRNLVVFTVTNSGETIPADKLPRIFDRFYRVDPSRSKETGGYGLGLSIAKTIVERSGGRIYAESAAGSTTITFELKLN